MTLEKFAELTEANRARLRDIKQKLIEFRRSNEGHETTHFVAEILNSFGLKPRLLNETGIVVDLAGWNSASKGVAVQVEIGDLLQTIVGLSVINFLNSVKDHFTGNLRILFQPVEKDSDNHQDALPDMSYLMVLNSNPELSAGSVGIKVGPVLSTKENFELTVFSRNSHSDVIPVAAHIVTTLNQLTTRKTDPLRLAEIVLSSIKSSDSSSNSVEITGCCITSDETVARQIRPLIEEAVGGLTKAYHANYHFQSEKRLFLKFNEEAISRHLLNSAEEVLGRDKAFNLEYTRNVAPSLYNSQTLSTNIIEIGSGSESKYLAEASIAAGFKTLCWALLNLPS